MIKEYISSIWETVKKFSDYGSCATRKEFWGFILFGLLFGICVFVISYIVLFNYGTVKDISSGHRVGHVAYINLTQPWDFIVCIFILAYIILYLFPLAAVTVRRLHDSGRSGFWMLVSFVPAVGTWILLFLLCLPTNPNSEYSETFFDSLDEK